MRNLLFLAALLSIQTALGALRITIDPGHGGSDNGATYGSVREANIALSISQKLLERLKKDTDFDVQMIRSKDSELSLESRVQLSENYYSDLFISIHANANPNTRAQGAEFYIQNQLPPDKESLLLAHNEVSAHGSHENQPKGDVDSIVFDLKKTNRILKSYQVSSYMRKNWTDTKKKMIRQGPFFVLSQNSAPAVLVEVGYLTNPSERRNLTQQTYQNQIAEKIHIALKDYAKNMDKLPPNILQRRDAKTR